MQHDSALKTLRCTLGSLALTVSTLFSPMSPAFAQVASESEDGVCVKDPKLALRRALKLHKLISPEDSIAKLKGLSSDQFARNRWDAGAVPKAARQYLSQARGASVILYAFDRHFLCAFLWRLDRSVIYSRTAKSLHKLNELADRFRSISAGQFHPNDRVAAKRLRNLYSSEAAKFKRVPNDQNILDTNILQAARPHNNDRGLLDELSLILFPPPFHQALLETDHLSIIPIGGMSSLPISLLKPVGNESLVIDNFSVNFLLNPGDVFKPPLRWTGRFKRPLILANPTTRPEIASQLKLGPIPATALEAADLGRLIDANVLSEKNATRESYFKHAPNADLIYFATHGLAEQDEKTIGELAVLKRSFLLLDEPLTGFDIGHTNLTAKLVVLSACQTGLGQATPGGVIGLARVFARQGAENVIMSLWNISDTATQKLMARFNRLVQNYPPSVALRFAQAEIRKRFYPNYPAYWAAFNIYGAHTISKN